MILSDVNCSCGSTVELLTTVHSSTQRVGWNVYCTGTARRPIRRNKLGRALLPRMRKDGPKPGSHWLEGIKAQVRQAITHYGHGAPRPFEILLDVEAVELFRYAR